MMKHHPIALLQPFAQKFDLAFLTKSDAISSDADIAKVTGAKKLVGLNQMHGNNVVVVREPSSRLLQADGLITDVSGLTLTIRFADCQGLAVFCPKKNIAGLIHAGWRGVVAGVVPSFFETLKHEFAIDPADTFVGISPSLCVQCTDFSDPHHEVPSLDSFIEEDDNHVDLRGALNAQLNTIGVPKRNIERMPGCTRCSPDLYWTYRGGDREKVSRGYVNCFVATLR